MQKKPFDKVQHPLMIKTLNKIGIKGTYLNTMKALYENSTVNIIINGLKIKAFPLRSGTRQGYPVLLLLLSTQYSPLLLNSVQ